MHNVDTDQWRQALTVNELSQRWGCHPITIRRLISGGNLPAFRVGREWRIRAKEVERHESANKPFHGGG
ncbi:helix-turn-helix domain-containing protein [Marinihelvus fidelis]|uniref:Helix-turn-helix domain-containing protein n=1 Tax=Marinihelvus fidelis TaxID=2613842 RepID=A0A5N0TF64_9GAMM|nr:helix-turn-helix domain-containing protein [Marinihelvus fidelis]